MLCFPAVLFSGAVVPVQSMTRTGHAIGSAVSTRWAFDAVGRTMRLDRALGRTAAGRDLLAHHGDAFTGSPAGPLAVVAILALIFIAGAHAVVSSRSLSSRGTARPRR
jgi:hypothetical protein